MRALKVYDRCFVFLHLRSLEGKIPLWEDLGITKGWAGRGEGTRCARYIAAADPGMRTSSYKSNKYSSGRQVLADVSFLWE